MVNCVIYKCSTRSENKPGDKDYAKVGFYAIPKVIDSPRQRTVEMSVKRRAESFRRNRRADLDESATHYKVCREHFISGRPGYVMNETDPDWAPSLHLGHDDGVADPTASLERYKRHKARKAAVASQAATSSPRCNRTVAQRNTASEESETGSEGEAPLLPGDVCEGQEVDISPPATLRDCGQTTDVTMQSLAALKEENRRLLCELGSTRAQLSKTALLCRPPSNLTFYKAMSPTLPGIALQFQEVGAFLIHLRLNTPLQDLAYRFHISQPTMSRVVDKWLDTHG